MKNGRNFLTQEAFYMDARTAELFFRICRRYGLETYPDRLALIRQMTARKKAKYLRDVQPFLNGKKVLRIRGKNEGV